MITVKTKIVIATGLFSALLCSCSLQKDKANGIESDPSQYAIQPGAKINIPVDDKKVVDFDSIFSDYYFIKLETTAESLIDETPSRIISSTISRAWTSVTIRAPIATRCRTAGALSPVELSNTALIDSW